MSETIFQELDDLEIYLPETIFQELDDLEICLPETIPGYVEDEDLCPNFSTSLQGSGLINSSWSGDVFDQLGDNIESIVRDDVSTSLEPCITTFLEKRLEIAKNFRGDLPGELPNEFTEVESEVDTAEMDTNSVGSLQTTREKGKITISKTELEKQFGKSLNDAAKALGASRSTVKRNRKLHGYNRWPKSRRDIPVKVKAKYGENKFIQFELFESSGIDELQDQVAKRLKKSYIVHYPNNEDELILIACDDDLQNHISSSKTLGKEYFNILLEQV